jgi:hypothetical protein
MKKIKEIMQFFECFLLNAMKKEENKGNNAIFEYFLLNAMKKKKIKVKMQFFDCFLLNAMKNEKKNAIFLKFFVECVVEILFIFHRIQQETSNKLHFSEFFFIFHRIQ